MAGSEPPMSPNLKPIATRPRGNAVERDMEAPSPPSSSGIITPKGRGGNEVQSESPTMGSDSSSPWRRFFRGGSRYPASDVDSFGNSPRNLMGFSPKAGSSASASRVSTPVKRKNRDLSSKDYGSGQINAYPPNAAGANPAAMAGMMTLAEELLTKKGLSLKDLQEEQEEYAETGEKQEIPRHKRPVTKHWNWLGLAICLYYIAAAIYYFVIRATRTLNMGYTGYGVLVLLIEIISSTATLGYAILLVKYSKSRRTKGLPIPKKGQQPDLDKLKFHVRVLIPCYKESCELVKLTVLGALKAPLPKDTLRTVYLCDDGKDPTKEEMIRELNAEYGCLEYVSGRKRDPNGETNGKSNNLNHCLKNVIYKDYYPINPQGPKIPKHEVMVVFDADMVAKPNFFTKILELMVDDDIALCLTPQGFNNVDAQSDIFNNLNLSFWEYMLPGTDAFGYIACTGTNFCMRCFPLADCGWFPTFTITEDYALGMILKAKGYKAGYLNEYLAIGEAPEEIRNIFRQRSRWCKGQMQVLFSRYCPLLDTGLTIGMRLLYTSVTWCYITNTFAVPCSVLVPFIALVFGIYPLVLNRDFALAATLYYTSSTLVTMYCTNRKHLKPLWFCIVSCHLLWFTFAKAQINVIIKKIMKKTVVFKSTKKKGEDDGRGGKKKRRFCAPPKNVGDMEGTLDAWVLVASFSISMITAIVGAFQMIDKPFTAQGDFRWFLALSIFWSVYNMIPPALFIFYCYNKGQLFEDFCSFCMTLSFIVGIGGIVCTWLVPDDYNLGQVLNVSLQFFEAQRSGKLPRISNTPWRGNSGLWDSVLLPNGKNYSLLGGWYDDGGMLKLSYTTAFTVSMLSWAYYEFKGGYKSSGNVDFGANTIRWGADYLMKVSVTNITSAGASMQPIFVAQVGDMAKDKLYWGSPEKSTIPRPATYLSAARPGTDAMAMSAAALASAAVAIQDESLQVADVYLQKAIVLYQLAQRWRGYYARYIESGKIYPSTSMYDDLSFAAVWIYIATGDENYLNDAITFYDQTVSSEGHVNPNPYMFNYENVVPALDLLLYKATGDPFYKTNVQVFVKEWMNTKSKTGDIYYTNKNLAKAYPYGTLQHTANAAFYTMLAAKNVMDSKFMLYACWARNQVGYMLGDAGRSYVTGYGAVQPMKTPHKAASCPPPDVTDCTWESAYYTTDPNYNPLRGGLVGGPDDNDMWSDDRDMNNPANIVNLLNSVGFSAAMAALVDNDINMAKCQQGNGFIQTLMLKAKGQPDASGQRWWEGV
eukprot:GHUV01000347.1.p1 GENE.GHUV01000347.1~~GHUV01000347.1.p1  ORF type:complete len:1266 (+),score=343.56 GHUV01000347.1:286-4083(+)